MSGGVFAFSTTTAPPTEALKEIQDQLLNAFRGKDDRYWGWRTSVAPEFRPVPIVANVTTVSNVSPTMDGTVPAGSGRRRGSGPVRRRWARCSPAPAGSGLRPRQEDRPGRRWWAEDRPGRRRRAEDQPGRRRRSRGSAGAAPAGSSPGWSAGRRRRGASGTRLQPEPSPGDPRGAAAPVSSDPLARHGARGLPRVEPRSVLSARRGPGAGSVSPFAQNAYSALVGSLPAAMIWASFHQGTGAITVWQHMNIRVWSPAVHIHMEGDWDKVRTTSRPPRMAAGCSGLPTSRPSSTRCGSTARSR